MKPMAFFSCNYSQVAEGRHAVIVFEGGMATEKIDFRWHICAKEFVFFFPPFFFCFTSKKKKKDPVIFRACCSRGSVLFYYFSN